MLFLHPYRWNKLKSCWNNITVKGKLQSMFIRLSLQSKQCSYLCDSLVTTRLHVSELLGQPCNKSDIAVVLVTGCQQVVANLLTTWDNQCEQNVVIACRQIATIFSEIFTRDTKRSLLDHTYTNAICKFHIFFQVCRTLGQH